LPAASRTSCRLQVASASPPRWPRVPHRADEHVRVEEVVGEPDAVTEERALGERARRVHGDDADRCVLGPHVADECADEARLPHSGGPVTPTAYALPVLG
jgi:hypothetical protein